MTRISGTELINLVDTLTAEGKTRSEICREAGYTSIKENGTERLHFTEFYTQLLEAKGGAEVLNNKEEDEWDYTHPEVDEEYMETYNDLCAEYSQQAVDFFLTSWSDCDLEDFRDYYIGYYDSKAQFVEERYDDLKIPYQIVVDWEATWEASFDSDFTYMHGYVFRNYV